MSGKTRPLVEVLVGIFGIFGYLWLIYPLYHLWIKILVAALLFVLLFLSNLMWEPHTKHIGLQWKNGVESGKILIPFTLATIPVLYGIWQAFFPVNNNFFMDAKFWERILIYPIWALFQQYIVLGFFFRRYREIFAPYTSLAVFFSASTFSLMHIPAPSLLVLCFVSGLVWAGTYHKYPNLYSIAISHAIVGAFCLQVLWIYGTVGPDADIGRWSKKQPPVIRGEILLINNIDITREKQAIPINRKVQEIAVNGWVATMKPIKSIYVNFGRKLYTVNPTDQLESIPKRYQNSKYEIIGFHAVIPLKDHPPGLVPISLKISLKNTLWHRSPGTRGWIDIQKDLLSNGGPPVAVNH